MRERWDNLLANAIVAGEAAHPAYADILRQLQPVEARALDMLVGDKLPPMSTWAWSPQANVEGLEQAHLDNLERLGLIRFFTDEALGEMALDAPVGGKQDKVVATALGAAFVTACRPPSASPGSAD